MRILVIGLGSIAKKHIDALYSIEEETEIFALRRKTSSCTDQSIHNIYSWDDIPVDIDFILISNPTYAHYETLKKALQLNKPIFLEKPPLVNLKGSRELVSLVKNKNPLIYVAFNLRFHPVILWAKHNLNKSKVREVNVYCGSYLPDWRPGADYSQSYSAKSLLGGGVHLDLIHEIDYLVYIFGLPDSTSRQFRKVSDLEIDAMDSAHYWLNYPRFTASVTLNYFRKKSKRSIEILTTDDVYTLDLIEGTIENIKGIVSVTDQNINSTYRAQLLYFMAVISGKAELMNSLEEGIETLKICLGNDER